MASCAPACCICCAMAHAMLRLLATPNTTTVRPCKLFDIRSHSSALKGHSFSCAVKDSKQGLALATEGSRLSRCRETRSSTDTQPQSQPAFCPQDFGGCIRHVLDNPPHRESGDPKTLSAILPLTNSSPSLLGTRIHP